MLTSRIVERVADHAVAMAEYLIKLKETEDSTILATLEKQGALVKKIFSDSVSSLFSQDLNLANDVVDRSRELKDRLEPLLKKVFKFQADEAVLLAYVINSIDRIASYGGDIGKITLNRLVTVKVD
jgi:phosphate uptake regulator